MTDFHNEFATYLTKKHQRYTIPKKKIVSAIIEKHDPFEIEALLAECNQTGTHMARASLYRTVKQLLDANLIQKITSANGKVCYKTNHALNQHDHIICNTCGQIFEFNRKKIDQILMDECMKLRFKPEYRSLHIYGMCQTCSTKTP